MVSRHKEQFRGVGKKPPGTVLRGWLPPSLFAICFSSTNVPPMLPIALHLTNCSAQDQDGQVRIESSMKSGFSLQRLKSQRTNPQSIIDSSRCISTHTHTHTHTYIYTCIPVQPHTTRSAFLEACLTLHQFTNSPAYLPFQPKAKQPTLVQTSRGQG